MTGEKYQTYPKELVMRQVVVDARDKNNRAKQFKVVTTILDTSIDGKQIGDLFERRWAGRSLPDGLHIKRGLVSTRRLRLRFQLEHCCG